jgi:hypothetical protein
LASAPGYEPQENVALLCVLHSDDCTALVFAALLANTVRQLALIAVGAGAYADRGEEVVAAALGGALLGMAPFGIRHGKNLSKLFRQNAGRSRGNVSF